MVIVVTILFKYCSVTREPTSKDKKSFNFQKIAILSMNKIPIRLTSKDQCLNMFV